MRLPYAAYFAFSFAANSCFTLRAIAWVSTLCVLASSRSTVVGFEREVSSHTPTLITNTASGECIGDFAGYPFS